MVCQREKLVSNSGDYHILTYAPSGSTGVDIEKYKDRSEQTYQTYLGESVSSDMDSKLLFYKAWLQKEISYKCGKSIDITYQTMIDGYIYGYAFDNTFKVELVYLKELLPDN